MLLDSSNALDISVETSDDETSELNVDITVEKSAVVDSSLDIVELPSDTPNELPDDDIISVVVSISVTLSELLKLVVVWSLDVSVLSVEDCSVVGVDSSVDDSVFSVEGVVKSDKLLVSEAKDVPSVDGEVTFSEINDESVDDSVEESAETSVESPIEDALDASEDSVEEISLDDISVLDDSVEPEEEPIELDSEVISEVSEDGKVVCKESPLPSNVGDAEPLSSVYSDDPKETRSDVSLIPKVDGLSLSMASELRLDKSLSAVNRVASPRPGEEPEPSSKSVENTSTP